MCYRQSNHQTMTSINEKDSLENSQSLLKETLVQFNYYSIECTNIQKGNGQIHCIYRGNANQPNIVLNKHSVFPIHFQTSDLFILDNIADCKKILGTDLSLLSASVSVSVPSKVLIIKHTPINNHTENIVIYSCFLLTPTPSLSDSQSLDKLLSLQQDGEEWVDLDVSSFVDVDGKRTILETTNTLGGKNLIFFFQKPISFLETGGGRVIEGKGKTKEGFVQLTGGYGLSNDNNNVLECDFFPDNDPSKEVQIYQVPVNTNSFIEHQNNSYVMMAVYSIYFLVFSVFVLLGIPFLWNILDNYLGYINPEGHLFNGEEFMRNIKPDENSTPWISTVVGKRINDFVYKYLKIPNIRYFDIGFSFFLLLLFIILTSVGSSTNNKEALMSGLLIMVIFFGGYFSILLNNKFIRKFYYPKTTNVQ